jgi:hypothetical protein
VLTGLAGFLDSFVDGVEEAQAYINTEEGKNIMQVNSVIRGTMLRNDITN